MEVFDVNGKITSIESVVIDGNIHHYFILDNINVILVANIRISDKLPFIKVNDEYYEKII